MARSIPLDAEAHAVSPSAHRVLVTGAAGWVGRGLVERLAQDGFQVLAVDRLEADIPAGKGRIEWHLADAADVGALRQAVGASGLHHVIHAATVTASPDDTPLGSTNYLVSHMAMANAALELAVEAGAGATFISSAAVFAPDQDGPLDERAPTHGVGPYASAKRAAELIWLEARRAGAMAQIVRLGNLFGPGERESATRPRMSILRRYADAARRDGRIRVEQPHALRDWTWLPDAAGVIVASIGNPVASPVLHVVAPRHLSDLQLAGVVAEAFPGTQVETVTSPAPNPRPPMISGIPAIVDVPWTLFENGLSMLLASLRQRS